MGDASGMYTSPTGTRPQNGGAGQGQGNNEGFNNASFQLDDGDQHLESAGGRRTSIGTMATLAGGAGTPSPAQQEPRGSGRSRNGRHPQQGGSTRQGAVVFHRRDSLPSELLTAINSQFVPFPSPLVCRQRGSEAQKAAKQGMETEARKVLCPSETKERGGVESGGRPDRKSSSQICETMRCIKSDRASKTPSTVSWSQQQLLGYSSM